MNFNKKDSLANAVGLVLQQEALKGGQKKLDKNHNGKLDKQDFKILRGEKKVEEETDVNDMSVDDLGGQKKVKRKDDVGPGGDFKATKVRFHAGPKNESLEEPLEKVLADTAPHSGIIKTVMGTELPDPNRDRANKEKLKMKESVSLKTFKEKYEENSLYDQMIQEVLSKDASAGDWIHDFVHSDNPKFAGKSKEQRKKMALGAYYAKQRNEEVESESLIESIEMINEVSVGAKIKAYAHHSAAAFDDGDDAESDHHQARADKIHAHILKHHGAEAAHHAEKAASAAIFGNGKSKSHGDSLSGGLRGMHSKSVTKAGKIPKNTQSAMKNSAKGSYGDRVVGPKGHLPEEVEQIDELTGKGKLSQIADYHKQKSGEAKDKMEKIRSSNRKLPVPFELTSKISAKDNEAKYHSSQEKRAKALMGKGVMSNILKKVKNEEVEQIDELSKGTLGSYVKNAARDVGASRKLASDFEHNAKSARKQSMKDANTRLSDKFKDIADKRHKGIGKAVERLTKEESEQLDELNKSTLKSYVSKATDSARTMPGYGTKDEKSKKTTRYAGISRATEKLAKEEIEQIDELNKETLKSYTKKAGEHMEKLAKDFDAGDRSKKRATKMWNRDIGSRRAVAKIQNKERDDQVMATTPRKPVKDTPAPDGRAAYYANAKRGQYMGDSVEVDGDLVEGWDDMLKAAKERRGPQPSGGEGKKLGSRYGGSKQKDKPEHDEDKKKVTESKRPETDDTPFIPPFNTTSKPAEVVDKSGAHHTPMSRAKHLAHLAMGRVKKDLGNKGK